MIGKHINKLNTNPFLSGIIIQSFHSGYNEKECPLMLHYIILPMILSGDIRDSLFSINKNMILTTFVSQNRVNLINLQEFIWSLRKVTNQALTVLHNNRKLLFKSPIQVLETVDYNNYNDDIKKYLRAAHYLGIMMNKETVQDTFKILKVIP